MLVHELLGVGRSQELTHPDGSRFAMFLALPAEPRAREPAGSRWEPAKILQKKARYVQQVRDVLRTSARGPSKGWFQPASGGAGGGGGVAPAVGHCRLARPGFR